MENQVSAQYYVDNNVERIYVDWPDTDHEEFRFISSRIEEMRNDTPSPFQPNIPVNQIKKSDLSQLRFKQITLDSGANNSRYEDLTRKKSMKKLKNSSVPPLDLISQNSSVELPGTKGVIDIDLRSSSESLSDTSQESNEQKLGNIERDSLEAEKYNMIYQKENNQSNPYGPLLKTTLPEVRHSDLLINPGEYDSSRNNDPNIMRKFSDISVPSQYKARQSNNEYHIDSTNETHDQRIENEKAVFEAVKQKYKQPIRNNNHNVHESQKYDPLVGSQQSKTGKSKPTLSVAPQMKYPLYNGNVSEKTPNFVELNKNVTNAQKQSNHLSYTAKFNDKYKKESPKTVLKKSESCKDSLQYENQNNEKGYLRKDHGFSSAEHLNRIGKPVEKTKSANYNVDNHDDPYRVNNFPINYGNTQDTPVYKSVDPQTLLYAYNQYGEPVLINPGTLIIANNNSNFINQNNNSSPYSPNHPEPYIYHSLSKDNSGTSNSFSTNFKQSTNKHDLHKSTESEIFFKDASFKRQPTLYDEKLLIKKLKDVKVEGSGSRFPPIPNTSDSSNSYSYVANQRRKEPNYDQYTLRDFKNIKQIDSSGGLGPNIGTELHKQQKEKFLRQKNYAKAVHKKNLQEFIKQSAKSSASSMSKVENTSSTNEEDPLPDKPNMSKDSPSTDKNITHLDGHRADSDIKDNKSHQNVKTISTAREPINRRDAMLNYAKAIHEKQIRKRDSSVPKTQTSKSQSANTNKDVNKNAILELIDNGDLDRLVQRHENDKKVAEQIRRNLGKIS